MPVKSISLLAFFLTMICMTSCRKSPTIWGTWQETNVYQLNTVNDSNTYEMNTPYPSGGAVFTFTVSGGYYSTYSSGRYIQRGSALTLTDSASGTSHSAGFTIIKLTDQVLVLQTTDTISLSPITTVQFVYTLSPA